MAGKDDGYELVEPIADWSQQAPPRSGLANRRHDDPDAIAEAVADLSDPAAFDQALVMSAADAVAVFRKDGMGARATVPGTPPESGAGEVSGRTAAPPAPSAGTAKAGAALSMDAKSSADVKSSADAKTAPAASADAETGPEAAGKPVRTQTADAVTQPATETQPDRSVAPASGDMEAGDMKVGDGEAGDAESGARPASGDGRDMTAQPAGGSAPAEDDDLLFLDFVSEVSPAEGAAARGPVPGAPVSGLDDDDSEDLFPDLADDLDAGLEASLDAGLAADGLAGSRGPAVAAAADGETAAPAAGAVSLASGDDLDLDMDLTLDEEDLLVDPVSKIDAVSGMAGRPGDNEQTAEAPSAAERDEDPFDDLFEDPLAMDAGEAASEDGSEGAVGQNRQFIDDPFADIDEQVARSMERGPSTGDGKNPGGTRAMEADPGSDRDIRVSGSQAGHGHADHDDATDSAKLDGADDPARHETLADGVRSPLDPRHEAARDMDDGDEDGESSASAAQNDNIPEERRGKGRRPVFLAAAASLAAIIAAGGWYGWHKVRTDPGIAIDVAAGIGSMLPGDGTEDASADPAKGQGPAVAGEKPGSGTDDGLARLQQELARAGLPDASGSGPDEASRMPADGSGAAGATDARGEEDDGDRDIADLRRQLDELSKSAEETLSASVSDQDASGGQVAPGDQATRGDQDGSGTPSGDSSEDGSKPGSTADQNAADSEAIARLAEIEKRLRSLEEALSPRLDAVERKVAEAVEDQAASGARLDALMPGMMTKIASMESRLESVEAKDGTEDMAAIAARLDELSSDIWLIARHGGGLVPPRNASGLSPNVPPLGEASKEDAAPTASPKPGPVDKAMGRVPSGDGSAAAPAARLVSNPDIRAGQYSKGGWVPGYGRVLEVRTASGGDYLVTENGTVFAGK